MEKKLIILIVGTSVTLSVFASWYFLFYLPAGFEREMSYYQNIEEVFVVTGGAASDLIEDWGSMDYYIEENRGWIKLVSKREMRQTVDEMIDYEIERDPYGYVTIYAFPEEKTLLTLYIPPGAIDYGNGAWVYIWQMRVEN